MKRFILPVLIAIGIVAAVVFVLQNNKKKAAAALPKPVANPMVPVRVLQVQQSTVTAPISLTGTVTAFRDVQLLSETSGRIIRMNANIGDYLPQGAVLLQMDDAVERAAYRSAEVARDKAKLDYGRYENLRKQNVGTAAQLDNYQAGLQAAEAQLVQVREQMEDKRVRMPFGGTLTSRDVDFGNVLTPGAPIANIVDITRLKVRVDVPEEQVFRLRKGSPAIVTVQVYPGKTFAARVDAIGAKGDANHTYPVDVVLPNSKANPLKAGMFARIEFTGLASVRALVIPRESLVGSSRDAKVYVVQDSLAVLRKVILGAEYGGASFAVDSGLKIGDMIVVSGQINLSDSTKVSFQAPTKAVATSATAARK